MSDTKALIKYVRDRLNDGPNLTFGKPTVYDLVEALEQAEAENARLNKMVDWLASHTADICASVYQDSYGLHWWTNCEWKEAARKAVAGEGK